MSSSTIPTGGTTSAPDSPSGPTQPSFSARYASTSASATRSWSIGRGRGRSCAVLEGVEVVGDAERGAELVLAAVATPDRLGLVVVAHERTAQARGQLAGRSGELRLLRQRQHRGLVRGDAQVEPQHDPLLAAHLTPRRRPPSGTPSRCAWPRRRARSRAGPSARSRPGRTSELLAGYGVLGQVVVAAVGDALELVPTPRGTGTHVGGARRVVRQLVRVVGPGRAAGPAGMPWSRYHW